MTLCSCGDPANDVISLSHNYHVRVCSLCAIVWTLVVSAIRATDGREWTMRDFNAWRQARRAA